MSESKFKNMRHIETVRNYLNAVAIEMLRRGEEHDQSKLQPPEVDVFEEFTPKLRGCTYGTDEYFGYLKAMKPAIDHHVQHNSHHPEYHPKGINGMNLFDLIEMLLDWKAAGLRHNDGDIYQSIELNQKRFGYSDELKELFINTMKYVETVLEVKHHAHES